MSFTESTEYRPWHALETPFRPTSNTSNPEKPVSSGRTHLASGTSGCFPVPSTRLSPSLHSPGSKLNSPPPRSLRWSRFRVLAIASKNATPRGVVAGDATPYSKADECDLTLNGYVAFLDPPKETARAAIKALEGHGIRVKVLTGDNELVARKVCKEVGLSTEHVLLGTDVEKLTDEQLAEAVEKATLFARVSPAHKQRIITHFNPDSTPSASWATASTTHRPCGRPTSASAWIPPWTSPRSRRT
jgi:hypothetical protein